MEQKDYRSLTFPQFGPATKLKGGRPTLSKLGDARLIGLRKLPGRVKTVTIVRKEGRWFAQFNCEIQVQHDPRRTADSVQHLPDVGGDTGLKRNLTLSDGHTFEPAKPLKKSLPRLRHEQKKMSRQFESRKAEWEAYKTAFKAAGLHGPDAEEMPVAIIPPAEETDSTRGGSAHSHRLPAQRSVAQDRALY